MRGIAGYYSFADNLSRLQLIQYILHHSCAKLFARKLKLSSRARVFHKFGKDLKVVNRVNGKVTKFNLTRSFVRTGKFHINPPLPLDSVYYALRSKSALGEVCSICGRSDDIEMLHVKAIKGKVRGFLAVMRAMNRKQIPVCSSCHSRIHRGLYDGLSLSSIKLNRLNQSGGPEYPSAT